ncbi:hypothetical protein Btru_058632 [Bulinus truncatus]|nr:hypothetical protein Btru_058632 [Bulinus truncatus]
MAHNMTEGLLRLRSRRQCMCLMAAFFVPSFLYVLISSNQGSTIIERMISCNVTATRSYPHHSRIYDVWPDFDAQLIDHEAFKTDCVPDGKFTISGIPDLLPVWSRSENPSCRDLYDKFTAIYTIEKRIGTVKIPETFVVKVKEWLGNNMDFYQELYQQNIIHIMNMYTRETTVFNPLRDKRPVTKPRESEEDYLVRITKESAEKCDFCKYKNYTAEHEFGRIESELSFSASNIFMLDRLHAVITIKDHDPINWSYDQYMDMMRITNDWLEKAFKEEPEAMYPAIIWDLLPKSGSSQLHPHNQVFLSPNRYQGMVESWRRAAQDYHSDKNSNYFNDLITLYSALGLAVPFKSAVALASLTPRKDNEVVIIAPEANDDFFQLIYYVLRGFMDDLKKYSFSLGGGYPAMDQGNNVGRIPAFVRIITRGVMTEIRTDISALELFTNLGNYGPLKCREFYALDHLQKQTKILEKLVEIAKSGPEVDLHSVLMKETNDKTLRELWVLCVDQTLLYVHPEKIISVLENKFGQKLAEHFDIRPIRVFYQLLGRILDVPTYVPEVGKTSIITLHQFMTFFQDGEGLNKMEAIAEELRLLDRLNSGSTDTVIKAILTLREDLPAPTGIKMLCKLLTSGSRETQQSATSYFKIINREKAKRDKAMIVMVEGLEDHIAEVRAGCCGALAVIEAEESIDQLVHVSQSDSSSTVRRKAKEALYALGDAGRKAVEEAQLGSQGFQGLQMRKL